MSYVIHAQYVGELAKDFSETVENSSVYLVILDGKVQELKEKIVKTKGIKCTQEEYLKLERYTSYIKLVIKQDICAQVFFRVCEKCPLRELLILENYVKGQPIAHLSAKGHSILDIIRKMTDPFAKELPQLYEALDQIQAESIQLPDLEITSLAL